MKKKKLKPPNAPITPTKIPAIVTKNPSINPGIVTYLKTFFMSKDSESTFVFCELDVLSLVGVEGFSINSSSSEICLIGYSLDLFISFVSAIFSFGWIVTEAAAEGFVYA